MLTKILNSLLKVIIVNIKKIDWVQTKILTCGVWVELTFHSCFQPFDLSCNSRKQDSFGSQVAACFRTRVSTVASKNCSCKLKRRIKIAVKSAKHCKMEGFVKTQSDLKRHSKLTHSVFSSFYFRK